MTVRLDGPEVASMRRRLGPVGWCAVECLAEASQDGRTAEVTVRTLATDLGVAKNTAHRAITCLVAAGLAEPVQERDVDGRFKHGTYRLHLEGLVIPHPRSPRRQPVPVPDCPQQLSLLD